MKHRRLKIIVALTALFVLCVYIFCIKQSRYPSEFENFLEKVYAERRAHLNWDEEETESIGVDHLQNVESSLLNTLDLEKLIQPSHLERPLKKSEIIQDIEVFFEILRTTYGAYEYFGGDEIFQKMQTEISNEVAGLPDEQKVYMRSDLEVILTTALRSVICDEHFGIGSTSFSIDSRRSMYYVPDLFFDDSSDLPSEIVKPTIEPDGKITYCFAASCSSRQELPKTVTINGVLTQLNWSVNECPAITDRKAYERTTLDGMTLLTSQTLQRSDKNGDQLDEFAASGEEYREASPFIIDLRGNNGGDDSYATQWLEGYLDAPVIKKAITAQRLSPLFRIFLEKTDTYPAWYVEQIKESTTSLQLYTTDGVWQENKNVIFVLIDGKTASSGEGFVGSLRTVDNVVFVGSSTSGAELCTNLFWGYLPNSGLMIQFGTKLNLVESLENRDGIGYSPDL